MIDLIILLSILGIAISLTLAMIFFFDVSETKKAIWFFFSAILCATLLFYLVNTDISRQISHNNISYTVGIVNKVTGSSINIDKIKYDVINGHEDHYKVNTDKISIGDIVRIRYLNGNFGNYIIDVNKLSLVDND